MSITVRRASVQDAAAYARIMGDPSVYPGLMQMPYTNEELWRARLTETGAPGKTDLLLVAELDGTVVGTAGLHPAGASPAAMHCRSTASSGVNAALVA